MIEDDVGELLQIAAGIVELDQHEGEVTDKRQWQANKNQYDGVVAHFNKQRDVFIANLLADEASQDSAVSDFKTHLAGLRERADRSWYPAIDYTENNVLPELNKQARRSPKFRRVLKHAPWVVAGLAVVAYFAIRLFSGVPLTADIQTREGIRQRAAAAEKIFRYDDWMNTRVRRGGMFKGLLLWPIEPTDTEIKAAADFAGLVLEGQQYAQGCATARYGERLSEAQVKMIEKVADYVQRDATTWMEPPILTVVNGLEKTGAC